MNVLDLFSGIGGFSLGLERAGMRTVAFCERDEYCRAVLRKHWPSVPCWTDIRGIDADGLGRLGRIDLICGGFPCQPFSVAGEQKGKEDDRHLWPEMRRVIALARPAWVIGENVTGLIPLALDDVLADLESLGYTARTFVIPACALGAPHRRDRLWIVAADSNGAKLREQSGWSDGANRADAAQSGVDGSAGHVAHTDSIVGGEGRTSDRAQRQGRRDTHRSGERQDVRDPNGPRLEIGQRQPSDDGAQFTAAIRTNWWEFEPDVGRVAHGVPRRVDRLRCLGNAVVPQVVEEIGRAIMSCRFDKPTSPQTGEPQ